VVRAFGRERDEWIARGKIALALRGRPGQPFESIRASYLLNNARFVLANKNEYNPYGIEMPEDEDFVGTCIRWAQEDRERRERAAADFERFKKMPMTEIVSAALRDQA